MTGFRVVIVYFLFLFNGVAAAVENPSPDSLRDLARLKQDSNPARLQALQEILREREITYEVQTFQSSQSPHGRTQGANVVITFGNGPREITVAAHYDALELPRGGMIDGMLDNGAGSITLIRVAEALKGRKLRHRVRIVLFDMEEIGLEGSRKYVDAHKEEILAGINLDVAGFGDSVFYGFSKTPGTERIRKALMTACADQALLCVDSENFPGGDDRSFRAANIPVVSLSFAPRLTAFQIWMLLNHPEKSGLQSGFMPDFFKILHSPEDNLSKIDPATLDLGFQLVLNTILKLDAALE